MSSESSFKLWVPGLGCHPVSFASCCWKNHNAGFFQFLGPQETSGPEIPFLLAGVGDLWDKREREGSLLPGTLCSGAQEEE